MVGVACLLGVMALAVRTARADEPESGPATPTTPAPVVTSIRSVYDAVPLSPLVLAYAQPVYQMLPMSASWLDFLVRRQPIPVRSKNRYLNTMNYDESFLVLGPAQIVIYTPRHLDGSSGSDLSSNFHAPTVSAKTGTKKGYLGIKPAVPRVGTIIKK
jgi:hypothetical protein